MKLVYVILFGLFGTVLASFLNVVIDRLPRGESLIFPVSHCPSCGHPLAVKDLIPVLSYIYLRGRCRYCKTPIPRRLLLLEVGMGLTFALLYLRYGVTLELAASCFYFSLFTLLMVIDLEHTIIPNKIVYPAAVISLIITALMPGKGLTQAALGGGVGLAIFLLIVIISRGGMGWEDAKMAALVGIASGYPLVLVAVFLAVLSGGLVAFLLLIARVKKLKEGIPFAPYLWLGALTTLLWGADILEWYLRLYPW